MRKGTDRDKDARGGESLALCGCSDPHDRREAEASRYSQVGLTRYSILPRKEQGISARGPLDPRVGGVGAGFEYLTYGIFCSAPFTGSEKSEETPRSQGVRCVRVQNISLIFRRGPGTHCSTPSMYIRLKEGTSILSPPPGHAHPAYTPRHAGLGAQRLPPSLPPSPFPLEARSHSPPRRYSYSVGATDTVGDNKTGYPCPTRQTVLAPVDRTTKEKRRQEGCDGSDRWVRGYHL